MIEFRFHGRGGQGVVLLGKLVARVYFDLGKHVKEFPKFGVERRGAPVEGYVRIDDRPIDLACQIYRPNVVIVMAESLLDQVDVTGGLADGSLILVNTGRPPEVLRERLAGFRVATVDASAIAIRHGLGTPLAPIANTSLFGAFARLMGLGVDDAERAIREEIKRPDRNVAACRDAFLEVGEPCLLDGPVTRRGFAPLPFATLAELPDFAYSTSDARGNRTGSWRSQRPRYVTMTAPCNARCPAGNDVRGFLEALGQGRPDRALSVLLETTPFPGVCGRVCPHPCEDECNRTEHDGAVAVMECERYAEAHGGTPPIPIPRPNGKRVAVVGAGPAGLSAAWQLARRGYEVVVHEAASHPGGMLLLGIPSFRLPREVLDREIGRISSLGVRIRCESRVGEDLSLERLLSDHDAVLLAVGQQLDRTLGLPGEELPGVFHGLTFLRDHNLGKRVPVGKRVVILGGGNTAVDVAGVCLRESETRDVTIVYRRTRAEMPAIRAEVEQVLAEGARLVELVGPVSFLAGDDGRVSGIDCDRMRLERADASGRPRPTPVPGSRHRIPCDQVILATGQATDLAFAGTLGVRDDRIETGVPGLYVCGDAATGEGTVAGAIGSGRDAAMAIDAALLGARQRDARRKAVPDSEIVRPDRINFHYLMPRARTEAERNPVETRLRGNDEVVREIADGCGEAARCISCGTCNGCDNCFVFCPEPAVHHTDGVYTFDLDYCKGCGVCFEECPRGAIDMMEET